MGWDRIVHLIVKLSKECTRGGARWCSFLRSAETPPDQIGEGDAFVFVISLFRVFQRFCFYAGVIWGLFFFKTIHKNSQRGENKPVIHGCAIFCE